MDELPVERGEVLYSILAGYSGCRDYIMLVLEKHNWQNNEFLQNVFGILKYIGGRSTTISFLVQSNMLWDAQILMRTVIEASMKLFFLCNCSEEERRERYKEFLIDLEEINSLKISELAKRITALHHRKEFIIQFMPLILSKEKEEHLKSKWSRKKRSKLEQKWSFHDMLREQSKSFKEVENILLSLAHPYKMSSHLIHADETGIGIVAERSLRSEKDKYIIELHHFCSIMKYSFDQLFLCGITICNLLKEDAQPLFKIYHTYDPIFQKIEGYGKEVYKDPDYDKYR